MLAEREREVAVTIMLPSLLRVAASTSLSLTLLVIGGGEDDASIHEKASLTLQPSAREPLLIT